MRRNDCSMIDPSQSRTGPQKCQLGEVPGHRQVVSPEAAVEARCPHPIGNRMIQRLGSSRYCAMLADVRAQGSVDDRIEPTSRTATIREISSGMQRSVSEGREREQLALGVEVSLKVFRPNRGPENQRGMSGCGISGRSSGGRDSFSGAASSASVGSRYVRRLRPSSLTAAIRKPSSPSLDLGHQQRLH